MTNEEMRKKLEKAAEKFCYDNGLPGGACASQISFGHGCMRDGYIAGAEYGYQEAIAQAKEWLKNNISDYTATYIVGCSKGEFISDFESDMNKLWEEKK